MFTLTFTGTRQLLYAVAETEIMCVVHNPAYCRQITGRVCSFLLKLKNQLLSPVRMRVKLAFSCCDA